MSVLANADSGSKSSGCTSARNRPPARRLQPWIASGPHNDSHVRD